MTESMILFLAWLGTSLVQTQKEMIPGDFAPTILADVAWIPDLNFKSLCRVCC